MAQTIGRTIGAQVRALRAARGLTQDELAQAASVPQGNISRLERGEVHDVFVSTLLDLANALHVDAMALLQPIVDHEKAADRARRDHTRDAAPPVASTSKPTPTPARQTVQGTPACDGSPVTQGKVCLRGHAYNGVLCPACEALRQQQQQPKTRHTTRRRTRKAASVA